jgi:hypothetical protein
MAALLDHATRRAKEKDEWTSRSVMKVVLAAIIRWRMMAE